MSNVLFAGDPHLDHRNITKYRTQFSSCEDAFNDFEEKYHKRVTKRDKCILTGDVAFSEEAARRIAKWPGQKVLIVGNHCTEHVPMKILAECFDEVHALLKYKEFWVSHAPMHPNELRGKINIHGHVHSKTIDDIRYFNTSLENIDYGLISLFEIREIIKKRKEFYETIYKNSHENMKKFVGQYGKLAKILVETHPQNYEFDFHKHCYSIPVGLK